VVLAGVVLTGVEIDDEKRRPRLKLRVTPANGGRS